MKNRISIKDIAQQAGVSHSTVSRALQGTGRMSDLTRERIRDLAEELGYTPDALAQSLVRGRTKTIGVVVTTIADPFVSGIVEGVEKEAGEAGYTVLLGVSHTDPHREMEVVDDFRQRRVDAVIVTASRVGDLYSEHLQRFGVPIVLVNNMVEGDYLYSVTCDQAQGAYLAAKHLLALGHRQIAYVGIPMRQHSSRKRWRGYARALEEAGLEPNPACHIAPDVKGDIEIGRRALDVLWAQRPTAIMAYNDLTAIGLMMAARERGIDVPAELSIVGFDDIQATQFVSPSLTTVHQPRDAMGRAAMRMVLDLLQEKSVQNHKLNCRLVLRHSTASPHSSGNTFSPIPPHSK